MSYYWIPCRDADNKLVCKNCDNSDGYTDKKGCEDNLSNYASTAEPCVQYYCKNKKEGYKSMYYRLGPDNYVTLGHVWEVQKPYTL